MKRVVIPELLDTDSGTEDEIRSSLADLRLINRWFGGISTTRAMLNLVVKKTGLRRLSLLEVAAGSGDVPIEAARQLRCRGVDVDVTLLDRSPLHLNGYRPSLVGDALALPFRDLSFDMVSCGLFAHHLEPAELRAFVDEALRVCRGAVLINDLRRSALHLALVYAGMPLYRSPITRHDAVASVRRSYTPHDFRSMFEGWGLHTTIMTTYLFRVGVVIWKGPQWQHKVAETRT
jgi:ubiquinone/menaquinone biosynthesis C-methylase UbiE